jgi:hypothetical protein
MLCLWAIQVVILWQLKALEQDFEKKEIVKVLMIDFVNYCVHDVVNLYNEYNICNDKFLWNMDWIKTLIAL